MKNTKFLVFCALIVVMILCSEIVSVKGRHLKPNHRCRKHCSQGGKRSSNNSLETNLKGGMVNANGASSTPETNVSKVGSVDDFRPTAPGRSPGVGHSIHD